MGKFRVPTVLSIAGFDGSGGAGIQADTKTISALGGYATNVLTALPVQNTQGVRTIYDIPTSAVADQIKAIFDDIYPDAIKIGMVHSVELVECIHHYLRDYHGPIVFDPVMVSTSGHQLIQDNTVAACKELLFPLATVITPNMDELGVLVGKEIMHVADMESAGKTLLSLKCNSVLAKGGHLQESILTNLLIQPNNNIERYQTPKIDTENTHGSGCSLSSAIATYLAIGHHLEQSVEQAIHYIYRAIAEAKDLKIGQGNGPLNHFFEPQKLISYAMES